MSINPNPHLTLYHLTYDMKHCWSQGPAGECSIITHALGTQYSALTALPAATACNVPSFQGHSKPSQTKLCQATHSANFHEKVHKPQSKS